MAWGGVGLGRTRLEQAGEAAGGKPLRRSREQSQKYGRQKSGRARLDSKKLKFTQS